MTEKKPAIANRNTVSDQSFTLYRLSLLGPGLLFAATSVGTSHLVQSTRAGALFGLSLLLIIICANAIKYPAFRFASDYFPATGTSLLEAYRLQGKGVLLLYFLITLSTLMFAVSALALLSAGIIKVVFALSVPVQTLALALIVGTAALLVIGHYKTLERVTKVLIILMMVLTLVATITVLPDIQWANGSALMPTQLDLAGILFIAALIGWMPVPLDAAVWQSLWAKSKVQDSGVMPTLAQSRFDFNLGYTGTVLLAVCFLLLGAGLMYNKPIVLANGAAAFSAQLIDLYAAVFGSYARPMIGIAALAIIYSSLLALMDAFPRTLSSLHRRWLGISESDDSHKLSETDPFYLAVLVLMFAAAALTYRYFMTSLTALVDIGAITAFTAAPIIAYLNHRAITNACVPLVFQPSRAFRDYSVVCIILLAIISSGYLYLRLVAN